MLISRIPSPLLLLLTALLLTFTATHQHIPNGANAQVVSAVVNITDTQVVYGTDVNITASINRTMIGCDVAISYNGLHSIVGGYAIYGNSSYLTFGKVYRRNDTSSVWELIQTVAGTNTTTAPQSCSVGIDEDGLTVFTANPIGRVNIYNFNTTGTGQLELAQVIVRTTELDGLNTWVDWTSDGLTMFATGINSTGSAGLRVFKRANTTTTFTLDQTLTTTNNGSGFLGYRSTISKTGKYVAVSSPDTTNGGYLLIYSRVNASEQYTIVNERLVINSPLTTSTTMNGGVNMGAVRFSGDEQWLIAGIMRWPTVFQTGGVAIFHLDSTTSNWTYINVLSWEYPFPFPLTNSNQGSSVGICQDGNLIVLTFPRLTTNSVLQTSCAAVWEGMGNISETFTWQTRGILCEQNILPTFPGGSNWGGTPSNTGGGAGGTFASNNMMSDDGRTILIKAPSPQWVAANTTYATPYAVFANLPTTIASCPYVAPPVTPTPVPSPVAPVQTPAERLLQQERTVNTTITVLLVISVLLLAASVMAWFMRGSGGSKRKGR